MQDLMVRLGLQNAGFVKGMQEAQQSLQRVAENSTAIQRSFDQLKVAAVALVGVWTFSKIIGETKDLIKESTMLSARYDTLGIVMTTVGRNAGVGAEKMSELQAGLESTGITAIQSRQNLIRMAQAQIDLNNATKLARIAQDAAVIGMVNSSEAFERLIYGIQSGNVRVLRTIGINVSFQKSYQDLAKELGKTTLELTEQEKSQAKVNAVMQAGERIQGAYIAAMDTAGKQMFSLERHIENFKVAFGAAFQPALMVLVQALTEAFKDLKKTVEDPAFRENLMGIANGFAEITSSIIHFVTYAKLSPVLETAKELEMLRKLGHDIEVDKTGMGLMEGLIADQDALNQAKKQLGITTDILKKMDEIRQAQDKLDQMKTDKSGSYLFSRISDKDIANQQKVVDNLNGELLAIKNLDAQRKTEIANEQINQQIREKIYDKRAADAKALADREEKAAAEKKAREEETAKELKKIDESRLKDQIKNLEEQENYEYEAQQAFIHGDIEAAQKVLENQKKSAKERSDALRDMYEDLKDQDGTYYDLQKQNLEQRAKDYAELTGDIAGSERWLTNELEKLDIEKGKNSNSFFEGMSAKYKELERDGITWGQVGYKTVDTFVTSATTRLTDFFDPFSENFGNLSTLAEGVFQDILRMWIQMLAEMIAKWIASGILELFGGLANTFNISSFLENTALGSALGIGTGTTAAATVGGTTLGPEALGSTLAYTPALTYGGATAAAGGVGATATELGGAGFEAFSVAPEIATAPTAATAGVGALGVTTPVLAAATLAYWGPQIIGPVAEAIGGIFGMGKTTAPSGGDWLKAWLAGVPAGTDIGYGQKMPSSIDYYTASSWVDPVGYYDHTSRTYYNAMNAIVNRDYDALKSMGARFDKNGIYTGGLNLGEKTDWWNEGGAQEGGLVKSVYKMPGMGIPQGEDGYIPVQIGEGVVSKEDMKILDKIDNMGREIHLHLYLDGKEITHSVGMHAKYTGTFLKAIQDIVR